MDSIAEAFARYFEHWQITLPPEALAERRAGVLHAQGWTIQYRFDADEHGEFLDFYATHRLTNDRHVRLRASGALEHLPAYRDEIIYPANATPEEKAQAEREFYEYNAAVAKVLCRKGFH